jgi:hypothetical protein
LKNRHLELRWQIFSFYYQLPSEMWAQIASMSPVIAKSV